MSPCIKNLDFFKKWESVCSRNCMVRDICTYLRNIYIPKTYKELITLSLGYFLFKLSHLELMHGTFK